MDLEHINKLLDGNGVEDEQEGAPEDGAKRSRIGPRRPLHAR